jgi:hypothetical protein
VGGGGQTAITQRLRRYVGSRLTIREEMEAAIGIEPMDKGFADLCLTTWLRRLDSQTKGEGLSRARCLSLGLRP